MEADRVAVVSTTVALARRPAVVWVLAVRVRVTGTGQAREVAQARRAYRLEVRTAKG